MELGAVEVRAPVAVLARVVARDGRPVIDRAMSIQKGGEGGGREEGEEPDGEFWVAFRNLDPDADYRVVSSLEGVEQAVRSPSGGVREMRVELRWDNEGVRCRLRFTVEGSDPVEWGEIAEGPDLEPGAWKKDGFLEHDMAAGDYAFVVLARTAGREGLRRYAATFKVPPVPLWEQTIDLREGPGR